MSIQWLPDGAKVRWRDGSMHRCKRFYFADVTRKEIKEFEAETKRAKRLGYLPQLRAPTITVGMVGEEWRNAKGRHLAPSTQRLNDWLWDSQIRPHLGGTYVTALRPTDIEAWAFGLATGQTVKRKSLALLHQVLNFAVKAQYLQVNPAALADRPELPAAKPYRPVTPQRIEQIRAKLNARDATFVSLCAYAGLRPQDARNADWNHIEGEWLHVYSFKTKSHRKTKLLAPVLEDLAAWQRESASIGGPIIPGKRDKARWSASGYSNWERRTWSELAPDTRVYDLRHTFVSLLLRDPAYSRTEVAGMAGHSLEVQERYAHSVLPGQGDAVEAIRAARRHKIREETRSGHC